jgi:hypothetical protein
MNKHSVENQPFDRRITSEHIQEYLTKQDDFSIELRTLNCLLRKGFSAQHGGNYVDAGSGKSRQFDLRANIVVDRKHTYLAVECKNLQAENPLIVSRIPRMRSEAFHETMSGTEHALMGPTLTRHSPSLIYPIDEFVGKSTAQLSVKKEQGRIIYTANDAQVYDKWTQALNSSAGLISVNIKSQENRFVIPIVVIPDNTLWVVDYNNSGELVNTPYLVEHTSFYVDNEYISRRAASEIKYNISHLHFYTESGFSKLLDKFCIESEFLNSIFSQLF